MAPWAHLGKALGRLFPGDAEAVVKDIPHAIRIGTVTPLDSAATI
jgi:hypothetical protein